MPELAWNKQGGKRDTRAGEMLEKKEKQEEINPQQSRGKGKAGAGVRSLKSRYSSVGTVAPWRNLIRLFE